MPVPADRKHRLSMSTPSPARRLLFLILSLAVAMGLVSVTAVAASAATIAGLEGDGSTESPLVLDSVADLDAVTAAINTDATTYGALSYRLDADLDYAGETFAGIAAFGGVFDGNGHAISNLVYGTAANSVAFFRTLTDSTVKDLTLIDVTGATLDGAGSAAVLAGSAARSTISGNTVIGSSVKVTPVGSTVNTQAAGLVAGTTGATKVTDNLVWNVDVSGRKYASALVAYPQTGAVIARNLVVDADVLADAPGAGSIAAMLVGQLQTTPAAGGVDVAGNVVVRGSAAGASARTFAAGISTMAGNKANLVSSATTFKTGTVAGANGTPATPEELAVEGTYEGLGWDLGAGTGAWRWIAALAQPVPADAAVPTYALAYDLAGGTVTDNPATYLYGSKVALAVPTRDGYEFAGWTGTDLDGPTLEVTIPAGARGNRSYVATWATSTSYTLDYDLAGGTVEGNPTTYTVESPDFTLVKPTRSGYEFAGWTGTGLTEATTTVTVQKGSTGARSYVATWTAALASIPGVAGHGTTADPFVIESASDLDAVATAINTDPATFGGLSYRLGADVDYAGKSYVGIAAFSGDFDGDGHAISDVVYDPAADSVAFFRTLTGAKVTDVTFTDIVATTATGAGSAAVVAVTATDSVVSGITVLGSSTQVAAVGSTVNTAAAGLVAGAFGTTRVTDNIVWDVTVTGRKYAAGLVTYPRTGVVVANNLLVDVDVVTGSSGGGSIAAMLIGQTQTGVDVAGNAVVRGSASGAGATKAMGLAAMTGSAPNLVSPATTFATGTVAGAPGTPTTPEELALAATYTGLGWNLDDGTGAWRWLEPLQHPVPSAAALPSYALSYQLAGGTVATANPTSYTLGSAAVTLVKPTRSGFEFAGWTGTGQTVPIVNLTIPAGSTGDRAYTATWKPAEYGLSYLLAGGAVTGPNPASYTVESSAFTLANPTRTGYAFAGWTGIGLDGPTATVTIAAGSTGDRTYTATWTAPIVFGLTYDLNGGVVAEPNPATYTVETNAFTLVNPTRAGYVFAGWTGTGLEGVAATVRISTGSFGERAYTATWTAVDYGVTYDVAGGSLVDGNRATYTIESPDFTLVNPTRSGYTFAGWTGTGLDGAVVTVTVPTGSRGSRAYTATWTPLAYALSYNLAGGSVRGNPATYNVESAAFRLVNPTRSGYRFAGWVGTGLSGSAMTVTVASGSLGRRSYTATWAALPVVRAATSVRLTVVTKAKGKKLAVPKQARLRVSSARTPAPTGTVVITAKGKVRGKTVTTTRTVRVGKGTTTVRLPAGLKRGTWKVTAKYRGDAKHLPSTTRTVKVRVTGK